MNLRLMSFGTRGVNYGSTWFWQVEVAYALFLLEHRV